MPGYRLTIRTGPRVHKERHDDLRSALTALTARGEEIVRTADSRASGGRLMRKFEPVQQVVGRLEVKGRGIKAGVDIRGDGSIEAFTGRLGRRLVELRAGESSFDALARELGV
ncbi:MAG: hypothetical protein ACR2HC_10040 [Thermoleophilaceae bacterium]